MNTPSFQTTDGCAISYTLRDADGPNRVVLIHSIALDRSIWDGVVEKLAGKASVLTYDARGHGRSGRVPGPYTTEQFAHDLAELMSHVGWPSAVIAGCSMGGNIAQAFGALYPGRAAGLGLIDTTSWYGAEASTQWRQRAITARAQGFDSIVDFQAARWFVDAFRVERPDVVSAATRVFLANDLDCYAASCEMLGNADLRPYLHGFRMPVAIVVGEEDFATPVASARQLHEAIAGSTLTIIKGRHLTPIECPDEIAGLLLTLLDRAFHKEIK